MRPTRKTRKPHPPLSIVPEAQETRRSKFVRLAIPRVNRALTSIRLLGNLASPNYQWDEADAFAIRAAIENALEQAMDKFNKHKKSERQLFALPLKEPDDV